MNLGLIAAVNAFPAPYALRGCINDAMDWRTTLAAKGFYCGVLLDGMATDTTFLANANYLATVAQPGDHLALAVSWHGSQARDYNGDEPDGLDEVWCPYNYFQGGAISDDKMRAILAKVRPGVTVDIFADCCHSGTSTREWIGKNELLPKRIPYTGKAGKVREFAPAPGLNHTLWAACRPDQLSREIKIGGKYRGAFSAYMCSAIRANLPTRAATMAAVASRIAAIIPDQTPQLECTEAASLQRVFA